MDATLGLCWPDKFESARAGSEGVPPEELPPLSREQTERAMEILKILFNITFNSAKSEVDEVIMDVLFLFSLYRTRHVIKARECNFDKPVRVSWISKVSIHIPSNLPKPLLQTHKKCTYMIVRFLAKTEIPLCPLQNYLRKYTELKATITHLWKCACICRRTLQSTGTSEPY